MKLAVCLFGQPRTWEKCINWIKQSYSEYDVDYFCSTKTYNTVKFTDEFEILDESQINKLFTSYESKKSFIEPFAGNGSFSSTMLSITSAINLKQEYEFEKNIHYDVVVVQRYDTLVGPNQFWLREKIHSLKPMSVYVSNDRIYFGPEGFKYGSGDLFFLGLNGAIDAFGANLINMFNPGKDSVKISDNHLISPSTMAREACAYNNIIMETIPVNPILIRPSSDMSKGITENWEELNNHWKPK